VSDEIKVWLCDPCLSAVSVPPWPKKRCVITLPFLCVMYDFNTYSKHAMKSH